MDDISSSAVDVVCVLDKNLTQVLGDSRPMKISVIPESKTMEHPIETGATITDHRVLLPIKIELAMMVGGDDYASAYQQVKALYMRGDLLTIQTRVDSYTNMLIEKMPHEESPDIQGLIALAVSFKRVDIVTPKYSALKVKNTKKATTVKRGEQQPTESKKSGSILSGLFK